MSAARRAAQRRAGSHPRPRSGRWPAGPPTCACRRRARRPRGADRAGSRTIPPMTACPQHRWRAVKECWWRLRAGCTAPLSLRRPVPADHVPRRLWTPVSRVMSMSSPLLRRCRQANDSGGQANKQETSHAGDGAGESHRRQRGRRAADGRGVRCDGSIQRRAGRGRHHAGRGWPPAEHARQARGVRWAATHGDRRAVHRNPRAGCGLLDLGSEGHGRSGGLGETLPNPMPGPSEIEIRPIYEMEDFAAVLDPQASQ